MGRSPSYHKIKDYIRIQIKSGTLRPNDQLPPQSELMVKFSVSRGTIHKAVQELIEEGLLYGVQGIGIFASGADKESKEKTSLKVIGMIHPNQVVPRSSLFIGLEKELAKQQYRLLLASSHHELQEEVKLIRELIDEGIEGLVLYSTGDEEHYGHLTQLQESKVPFVMVNTYVARFSCPLVVSDNVNGGYLAGKHLCELGHERLAVMWWTNLMKSSEANDRLTGFMRALNDRGISFEENGIFGCDRDYFIQSIRDRRDNREEDSPILDEVRRMNEQGYTAVFCLNDTIATELLYCTRLLDISVPEQLSVVGFDDAHVSTLSPPLTTIRQPLEDIGKHAAKLLMSRIRNEPVKEDQLFLPVELIVRESTRSPLR
jgi:GntR family transcriptional regulator of arabinose operon